MSSGVPTGPTDRAAGSTASSEPQRRSEAAGQLSPTGASTPLGGAAGATSGTWLAVALLLVLGAAAGVLAWRRRL